jgi:Porphyromonas-type peptidyl-arginine deiminase
VHLWLTRSRLGRLRINDWNFNYWGNEEPESFNSTFEEGIDRTIASVIKVPVLDARTGPATGVRLIHEGGSASHNGRGTMIAVESVVMQRNLGPNRFCGGQAPVTDYDQPNTYAPNPDWPRCKALVENEYRRMLGVKKVILKELFPGREVVQVNAENVIRGGGGMNCITQQQPASAKFTRMCGWAKVQVTAKTATLYAEPVGEAALGSVPRLSRFGDDIYLKRLSSSGKRVQVRVVGVTRLNGETGWMDEDDIESAGEKCPFVYSPN